MKISLLLPARGRPANLKESVESAYALARYPDKIELMVRLDRDDKHLPQIMQILQDHSKADLINIGIAPRVGYARMHEMYDWCAENAKGKWLFFWNDDMTMLSQDWDALTCEAPEFSVQFPRRDTVKSTDYTLPVVGRPIFEALGHLSLNAYCDAWLSDIAAFAGISVIRDDIVFRHHRLDDETLREQAVGSSEWQKFATPQQKAMRWADMEKLMSMPAWATRFDGWDYEMSEHIGVDYINLAAGQRKAQAAILKGRK